MTIGETINKIKDSLQAELPAFLGILPNFAYRVGYPENQDDVFCCVRLSAMKGKESVDVLIHLSLPAIKETDAYGYLEAVKKYIDTFRVFNFGYDKVDWALQIYESDFVHGDIQAVFNLTLAKEIDDCFL